MHVNTIVILCVLQKLNLILSTFVGISIRNQKIKEGIKVFVQHIYRIFSLRVYSLLSLVFFMTIDYDPSIPLRNDNKCNIYLDKFTFNYDATAHWAKTRVS